MKPLVIFGTGTFAELSHYYFTSDSAYDVAGFTVDRQHQRETTFKDLPVVAFEDVERHYPPSEFDMFVALGIREVVATGAVLFEEFRALDFGIVAQER